MVTNEANTHGAGRLNGNYPSGLSHFSETNTKLAKIHEFATHFVQRCLEMKTPNLSKDFRQKSFTNDVECQ